MVKSDLSAKKQRWSSDNVVVVKRRPKKTVKKVAKPIKPVKPEIEVKKTQPEPKPKPKRKHRHRFSQTYLKELYRQMLKVLPIEQPYKIGIDKDVMAQLEAMYDNKPKLARAIKTLLKGMTKTPLYLQKTRTSDKRYGLDGKTFPLSEKHKVYADTMLKKFRRIERVEMKRKKRKEAEKNG